MNSVEKSYERLMETVLNMKDEEQRNRLMEIVDYSLFESFCRKLVNTMLHEMKFTKRQVKTLTRVLSKVEKMERNETEVFIENLCQKVYKVSDEVWNSKWVCPFTPGQTVVAKTDFPKSSFKKGDVFTFLGDFYQSVVLVSEDGKVHHGYRYQDFEAKE